MLQISEKQNDLEWTSAAHLGLGNVARERYLDLEAKEHYYKGIALSLENGNDEDADAAKANLAVILRRLGQFEECFELLEELVAKARQRDDLVNLIITLITYAISLGLSGRPQKVPEILFECWGLCNTLNYPSGKYRCLTVAHTLSIKTENWRDAALFAGSIHALEHKSDYVTESSLQTYQSYMQLTKVNLLEEEYEEAFQTGSRLALPSFKLLA